MKRFFLRTANRLAPRTMSNLRQLSALDEEFGEDPSRFISYEREIRELRREIDELRRDNRRVAELYDAVYAWCKENAAARGITPLADPVAAVDRVAAVITNEE